MKHLISVIILAVCAFCSFACDPPRIENNHIYWYAKNTTNEVVSVSWTKSDNTKNDKQITPGDSVLLVANGFISQNSDMLSMDLIKNQFASDKVKVDLYSNTGQFVKTWTYEDGNSGCRQMFNESYNRLIVTGSPNGNLNTDSVFVWVFDIIPEDLAVEGK